MNRRDLLATGAAGALTASALSRGADARAAGERAPNILLLMTDQERHRDRLPDDLPVPLRCWLDRNGTNIDRFHASSMACSPSRGCYWTGMYAPQQGMYGTFVVGLQFNMDPSIPTIGDLFKEVGYRTAFFGKWHLSYPGEVPSSLEQALDTAQGSPLHSYGFDDSVISPPSDVGGYNDGYTNDPVWTGQAVNWLKQHANDTQPWLCILSLLNPHDIQFYPRGFLTDYKRPDYDPRPDPSWFVEPTLADKPSGQTDFKHVVETIAGTPDGYTNDERYVRDLLNTYYDLTVNTDAMLAEAVKTVIDAGALDHTAIVRCTDHGELGGAHRLQNKGTTMYDEQNRVPFTVVYPKRFAKGARSNALGEAVDLAPTLLEIAGEPAPVKRWPWLRGVSLVPALEHPASAGPRSSILYRIDEFAVTSAGHQTPTRTHIRAIHEGRYKFARYVAVQNGEFVGPELRDHQELELYDTWDDPYEIRNLANDKGYAQLTSDLLAFLYEREKLKFGPVRLPAAFGPGEPVTAYPEIPDLSLHQGGLPDPWPDLNQPGAYFRVPAAQPTPATYLYEGGLPSSIGGPPSSTAHAADTARFFCELTPS